AAAYAANIIAIYQAYRWNAYVEAHRQDPKVWHGLVDNDSWQADYLTGEHLHEYQFWLGSHAALASGSPTPPASGGASARTASATGPAPGQKPAAGKKTPAKKKVAAAKKKPAKKIAAAKKKAPARKKAPVKKAKKAGKKKAAQAKKKVKKK